MFCQTWSFRPSQVRSPPHPPRGCLINRTCLILGLVSGETPPLWDWEVSGLPWSGAGRRIAAVVVVGGPTIFLQQKWSRVVPRLGAPPVDWIRGGRRFLLDTFCPVAWPSLMENLGIVCVRALVCECGYAKVQFASRVRHCSIVTVTHVNSILLKNRKSRI